MTVASASLPYEEPGIVTLLILTSFLLLANVVNHILDRLVYCGLLGQVFLGVAFGTPGGQWLPVETQEVIVNLGYLGLILLVYEGGLSTEFSKFKANLVLSSFVALTGIGVPIGLAYVLPALTGATTLQAFVAGAALCSTSLGTTFAILSSSGLKDTRLAVVLTSAAMLDDVVGLIMTKVVSSLGAGSTSTSVSTIVRPIFVSIAFAIVTPAFSVNGGKVYAVHQIAFLIYTLVLVVFVTAATYAGTSNLFAAYLAGACTSWWNTEVRLPLVVERQRRRQTPDALGDTRVLQTANLSAGRESGQSSADAILTAADEDGWNGDVVYRKYYEQVVTRVLKPFFFASIGFSIPVSRMFAGPIVWRGIVFAILMIIGKLLCGLWLVRLSIGWPGLGRTWSMIDAIRVRYLSPRAMSSQNQKPSTTRKRKSARCQAADTQAPKDVPLERVSHASRQGRIPATGLLISRDLVAPQPQQTQAADTVKRPLSLYPASILGLAMVARGEIGFLISSTAQSQGLFFGPASTDTVQNDDSFLVVTWAIMLCTIVGPLGVGLLVKRVKRIEGARVGGNASPLGLWGVSPVSREQTRGLTQPT